MAFRFHFPHFRASQVFNNLIVITDVPGAETGARGTKWPKRRFHPDRKGILSQVIYFILFLFQQLQRAVADGNEITR